MSPSDHEATMLTRRTVLTSVPAAVAVASVSANAGAEPVHEVKIDPANMTDAEKTLHAVRWPKLDQESTTDFVLGFKKFLGRAHSDPARIAHTKAYLQSQGIDGAAPSNLGHEEAWNLMMRDPLYAMNTRLGQSSQDLMWDRVMRNFHNDAPAYLTAMEKTDKSGPGRLELNPDLDIPAYARQETHRQPGGYVGDPFAGWVYHWALTKAFYQGRSDHDEMHEALAQSQPLPADGQVRRVLDIGCAAGMTTTAFKERFPDAEVWGIDSGAPMVRYAHHRAVKMNLAINYAQRLAEDSKFPDNHFCMVHDFFLFHEVEAGISQKIANEMFRIMRPGGVWKHNDIASAGNPNAHVSQTVLGKASSWDTHRHNYDVWWITREETDFPDILRNAGFTVDLNGDSRANGVFVPRVIATKPV